MTRDIAQAYMDMVRRAPPAARLRMLRTLKKNSIKYAYSPKKFEQVILARVQTGIPRRSSLGRRIVARRVAKLRRPQKAAIAPPSLNKLFATIKL